MTDNFTADNMSVVRPYDFGQATFMPFQNFKFVLKLMLAYLVITIFFSIIFYGIIYSVGLLEDMFLGSGVTYWTLNIVNYLIFWPIIASFFTAYYKRTTMGYDGGWFPMRFGAMELRVMAVQFLWFVSLLLFSIIFFFVLYILTIILGSAAGNSGAGFGLAMIIFLLGYIGYFIAIMYFSGRLSAASPLTVMRNKFTFWETFKATRKRGWWIVLSYFVQFLIILVAYFVIIVMIFGLIGGTGVFQNPDAITEETFLEMFSNPAFIISALIGYLFIVMIIGFLGLMFPGVGAWVAREYEGGHNLDAISALYD